MKEGISPRIDTSSLFLAFGPNYKAAYCMAVCPTGEDVFGPLLPERFMKVEGSIEFTVIERGDDRVVSEMPIHSGMLNPFGVIHAGAMLWLADVTATVLVLGSAEVRPGMTGFPLGISLNANFVGNQRAGSLRAVSEFVKRGRTVSVVRTSVYGDGDKLLADVTTSHVLSK